MHSSSRPLMWVERRRAAAAAVGLLSIFVASSAIAGFQDKSLSQVEALALQQGGGKLKYHYSVGAKERADRVARLVIQAQDFFATRLGFHAPVNLAVLNEKDWRKINPQGPYGIPYLSEQPHVIFIPATDDNIITASVLAQERSASVTFKRALQRSGRSFLDWSRTSVELIALHELGHAYIESHRLNPGNKWFNEFLASYHAYVFLAAEHPHLARLWRASAAAQIAAPPPKHTSLEDFERLYTRVGPENYGWYQALFIQKAAEIHDHHGLRFITQVQRAFPKLAAEGDWLNAFLKAQEPVEVTLGRLNAIHGGFAAWGKKSWHN